MNTVFILRGPPGSGKSTWVKTHYAEAAIFSADQFFTRKEVVQRVEGGPPVERETYRFDISRLAEAHQDCLCRFIDAIMRGIPEIVVDNTNIHHWEYRPYKKIAAFAGYETKIVEFRPETLKDTKVCIDRNVHGVPPETITRMCMEFEPNHEATRIFGISS